MRLNANGTLGKCGHMVNPPGFQTWDELQQSQWLSSVRLKFENNQWPEECQRCQQTEATSGHSIRLDSIQRDQLLKRIDSDYIILGGVLDNVCNSACQSCNSMLSTKIGSLTSKTYPIVDNSFLLSRIPWERIVELDINGGEPTASPKYQNLLQNLPENLRILRVNTNGSRVLPNIENILSSGIRVLITLSLDGLGSIHDYVRWPIKWDNYVKTVARYQDLKSKYPNLSLQSWTTLYCFNVGQILEIRDWSVSNDIAHSWAWLSSPAVLDAHNINQYTLSARENLSRSSDTLAASISKEIATTRENDLELAEWVRGQDRLRNIEIKDYI